MKKCCERDHDGDGNCDIHPVGFRVKSQLRLQPHSIHPGSNVVEVWHEGKFIATVTGSDGPGVRVITKHSYDVVRGGPEGSEDLKVVEIRIESKG